MSHTTVQLTAQKRSELKSRAARALRKSGFIPAVIYGKGKSQTIKLLEQDFTQQFHSISENTLIDLHVEKKLYHVIIKDYSTEPLSGQILHLDFLEIEKGKALKTHVPLVVTGSAIGVRTGGVFEQPIHALEVECLPKDIPEKIEVDVSDLDIGQFIRIADLNLASGVKVMGSEEQVLVHVAATRLIDIEEPAEETDEEEDETVQESETGEK